MCQVELKNKVFNIDANTLKKTISKNKKIIFGNIEKKLSLQKLKLNYKF